MKLDDLDRALAEDAALRRRQVLQPVGGKGDKIFPPTYPGEGKNVPPRHVFERRRVGDGEVWCVLVDSVQSQANRLEECLRDAARDGIKIPHVVVDFSASGLAGVAQITSLDAPHRVYDAILRDSLLDGKPFLNKDSPVGKRLLEASAADASALLEVSPNALLFGAWNSTGQGGGLGAKFARCLVSELVAVNVPAEEMVDRRSGEIDVRTAGRRTGSRIDPLGVLSKVHVFKSAQGWDLTKEAAGKAAKEVKPSEINHGNIAPTIQPLGITCAHVEHVFVLSFAALRRLRFGTNPDKGRAGRATLAALGLLALVEQDARGYALRSRCDLVCDGAAPLELVHADGSVEAVTIDRNTARGLYAESLAAASRAGFDFRPEPLRLTPQPKLVEIVRRSQELALSGEGEGADDDGAGT
ncbi:MAG: type I-U CRISPR-associated RAMP protein Csb1/Cas7u [Rubrivivax sp.]